MALETNTYKSLGLPTRGNTRLTGVSTADIYTLQHSSANQGNFLTLRDAASSVFPDSTVTANDILRVTEGGGITAISTVLGDVSIQGYRKPVIESTAVTVLTEANSGTLFVVSSAVGTSFQWRLPTGSGVPGVFYEFWMTSDITSGDVKISASSDVVAKIFASGLDGTSVISTFALVTPDTDAGGNFASFFARLTAVTSLLWMMETNQGGASSVSTLNSPGKWKVGSTG